MRDGKRFRPNALSLAAAPSGGVRCNAQLGQTRLQIPIVVPALMYEKMTRLSWPTTPTPARPLIRELLLRADVQRVLIVAPGSLVEQWQDELAEKFGGRAAPHRPGTRGKSRPSMPHPTGTPWPNPSPSTRSTSRHRDKPSRRPARRAARHPLRVYPFQP